MTPIKEVISMLGIPIQPNLLSKLYLDFYYNNHIFYPIQIISTNSLKKIKKILISGRSPTYLSDIYVNPREILSSLNFFVNINQSLKIKELS